MDALGAATVVEKLDALKAEFGPRFEPAAILRKHAQNGTRFYPQ